MLVEPVTGRARYRWLVGPAAARARWSDQAWRRSAGKTLFRALLGVGALLVIARMPSVEPLHLVLVSLLAAWLCFASVLHQGALWLARSGWFRPRAPRIPLRFGGPTGRFSLRRFDHGRKVVVTDGTDVVAEVVAADDGDQVVLYEDVSVTEGELEELGSAIGQAIEIAVTAEQRPVARAAFE